jgi:Flp pilus assembly protein TadG
MASRRLTRLVDRRRAREGSAAIEFAMVALPFFFMMFAVLELALVFVIDSVLENAAIETGRLVRTGQADAQNFNATTFRSNLCDRMSIFSGDCTSKVTIDVRRIPQFSNPNVPDPLSGASFDPNAAAYDGGDPGDIMLVRAWYQHTLLTPFLAQGLSKLNDGKAYLTATTAFRNEPYD